MITNLMSLPNDVIRDVLIPHLNDREISLTPLGMVNRRLYALDFIWRSPEDRRKLYSSRGGHLALLDWLQENNCPTEYHLIVHATISGRKAVIQWLENKGYIIKVTPN